MLTHRACTMSALNYITSLNVRPTDVYLHTLPMFHANGWGGIWALGGLGGTQVCLRRVGGENNFSLLPEGGGAPAPPGPTRLGTLATFSSARASRASAPP